MTSTENKQSMLASLTSLISNESQDDILPLAVHDETCGDGSIDPTVSSSPKESNSSSGKVDNGLFGGSNLSLEGSGLLNLETAGGLFDAIEEEEHISREEAERKAYELKERKRLSAELQQEKQLADKAGLILQEEARVNSNSNSNGRLVAQNHEGENCGLQNFTVMGGMQEMNLNDDGAHHHTNGGFQHGAPVYSNVINNVAPKMQSQSQIMQSQSQYSNMNSQNHSADQLSSPPPQQQQQQQQQPSQGHMQRQQTQEADFYGGSSYYYSTTGNVQQVYQQPKENNMASHADQSNGRSVQQIGNHHQIPRSPAPTVPPSPSTPNSSYALRSQMRQPTGGAGSNIPAAMPNGSLGNHNQISNGVQSQPMQYNYQGAQNGQNGPGMNMNHNNSAMMQSTTHVRNGFATNANANHPSSMMQSNMQSGSIMGGPNFHSSMIQSNGNGIHAEAPPAPPQAPTFMYNPGNFEPLFGPVSVTDPILVQSPGILAGPPHWTYAVIIRDMKKIEGQEQFSAVVSSVRRRFRHFVALEERTRRDCRGAILPPRPNKHSTRAIDEATTRQSAQFALQRAKELETYLNALRLHPLAGKSQVLKLFLTLPDHLGVAWPEVSSSIFTRLTEAGASTAVKVAESTSAVIAELNTENQIMAGEDNAELLALTSAEGMRISGVLQAVPKIENAVVLVADQAERKNAIGMEMQKLVNNVFAHEKVFSGPFEILASGLLRCGRRTNRLAVELGAASEVFSLQHKLCKYERLAFADRRSALVRRRDAKKEADLKSQKLVMQQHQLQSMGKFSKLDSYGREAAMADEIAVDAIKEADEIGHILLGEVNRISKERRVDWGMSLRVMAANLREAHAERVAIWEGCRNALVQTDLRNNEDSGMYGSSPTEAIHHQEGSIVNNEIHH